MTPDPDDMFVALEDSKPIIDPNNCIICEIHGNIPKWAIGTGQDELRRQQALGVLKKSMEKWGHNYHGAFEYEESPSPNSNHTLFTWRVVLPREDS